MSTNHEKYIQKTINDFKFIDETLNCVNNTEFLNGVTPNSLSTSNLSATNYSSFYTTLSAIGEDIFEKLYNNVLNYIDNVGNVEVCTIKSLQSMIDILGVNYTLLHTIELFPLKIQKLIDILSITPEYLVKSDKINRVFSTFLQTRTLTSDNNVDIDRVLTKLSDVYNEINDTNVDISANKTNYIDRSKLEETISSLYNTHIRAHLLSTYYDQHDTSTAIFNVDPTTLYKNYINNKHHFIVRPAYISENITATKAKYNIPFTWNESIEVDKIDNGLCSFSSYTPNEQEVLSIEIDYRKMRFNNMKKYTAYSYYRERTVQDYLDFVEYTYANIVAANLSSSTYDIDPYYLEYKTNDITQVQLLSLVDDKIVVNNEYINAVVKHLTQITTTIWNIRHELKIQAQKQYMKGTFLFLSYCINEYLKTAMVDYFNSNITGDIHKLSPHDRNLAKIELIEYYDPTKYYNISTDVDQRYELNKTNPRYWESSNSLSAVMTENTTNIFSPSKTVASQYGCFSLDEIYDFYINILKTKLGDESNAINDTEAKESLHDFLSQVFDSAAERTFLSGDELFVFSDKELSAHKRDLFLKYSGDRIAEMPYAHVENLVHPSYKIHPYLYQFIEQNDIVYEVKNMARLAEDTLYTVITHNIDKYIDEDGYLLSAWNNPLNRNADYLSEYEASPHYDADGNENPIIGYDGLFYPLAYEDYKTYADIPEFYDKWYKGLNISDQQRDRITRQLRELKNTINSHYNNVIYRYGKDIYGNMYILTKSSNELTADGMLWIRLKDHPIAFPAYWYSNNLKIDAYSQIDDNTLDDNVVFKQMIKNNANTPTIYDFYISNTKQQILLYGKNYNTGKNIVVVANISQKFNNDLNINRFQLFFTKNGNTESTEANLNVEYKFRAFYNYDQYPGFLTTKYDNTAHKLTNIFSYFIPNKDGIETLSCNVTFDTYYPSSHSDIQVDMFDTTLTFAFINNNNEINNTLLTSNMTLITGNEIVPPEEASSGQYIKKHFDKPLVVSSAKIPQSNAHIQPMIYSPLTDMGFFPCPEKSIIKNTTKTINLSSTAIYDDIANKRGIGKFQILGPESPGNGIFFRFTYPLIRMFETIHTNTHRKDFKNYCLYNPNNKITSGRYELLSYNDIHYFEEVVRNYKFSKLTFTPSEFKREILNSIENQPDLTFKVSEEFKSTYKYDQYFQIPYLLQCKGTTNNLPIEYWQPGKTGNGVLTANISTDNMTVLNFPDSVSLSVYWYENLSGQIKLDFNSQYFNRQINSRFPNYYNYQHTFLNLDEPGECGYLKIYKNSSRITSESDFNNDIFIKNVFFIKNISDDRPKFLLSIIKKATVTYEVDVLNSTSNINDCEILLVNNEQTTLDDHTYVNILGIK